ncbi:MAG: ribokinase, partial [Actinomycetales bacterium]|nr:ribokinase [Actinomycetales bacterium]
MGERVAVVGSANMDLVVRVEAFPRVGETVSGLDLVTVPG